EAEQALKLDSGSLDAHYTIGVVRLRNGDFSRALEAAEAAIRSNPDYAEAYLLKSQALISSFQGSEGVSKGEIREKRLARYKEAAESLEKYLKLFPGTKPEVWREQLEDLRLS